MRDSVRDRLVNYKLLLEELMTRLDADPLAESTKDAVKSAKLEFFNARNLHDGISDAYLRFPKLNSNPIKSNWHTNIYDAHISITWALEHS